MIYLKNTEDTSPIVIDKDIVMNYKHEGDLYLIAIQHNLTKQLVAYTVYYDLQQVNNAFFKIIKYLIKGYYDTIEEYVSDYGDMVKLCDVFLKGCETFIPELVYDVVEDKVNDFKLLMQKLNYIVEKICYSEENA